MYFPRNSRTLVIDAQFEALRSLVPVEPNVLETP